MKWTEEHVKYYLNKWQDVLRLRDWDLRIELVTVEWKKTGDIKIDRDDKKAILMINTKNPKQDNLEAVVIHELLHLKLWEMDQLTEQLIYGVFGKDENDPKFNFAYSHFMTVLESTVEDLSKSFLEIYGENKDISFGRIQSLVNEEINK